MLRVKLNKYIIRVLYLDICNINMDSNTKRDDLRYNFLMENIPMMCYDINIRLREVMNNENFYKPFIKR